MSSWYKVTLRSNETAPGTKGASLQDVFEAVFISAKAPKGAALLGETSRDFQHYTYYFSPGAHRIASYLIEKHHGTPCPAPSGKHLSFLVGHETDREELLKDGDNS